MAWSWDEMYEKAIEYYKENGDLLVPQPYICKDGAKLGKWICTQRMVKNGRVKGILDAYRIESLEAIGMDWNPNLTAWNKGYEELKKYYLEYKNIDVPLRFSTEKGFRLGLWLQNQRRAYLKKGRGALNQEQINRLELLQIVWDPHRNQWMKNYSNLKKYYEEHGNINLPCGYSIDGVNLYEWLGYQRATYNGVGNGVIDEEQIELLEELEIGWENKLEVRWNDMYIRAKEYFEKYGHLNMLYNYTTPNGEKLGSWVFTQRINWRDGKLENDRKELLDQIGMNWDYASKNKLPFLSRR